MEMLLLQGHLFDQEVSTFGHNKTILEAVTTCTKVGRLQRD